MRTHLLAVSVVLTLSACGQSAHGPAFRQAVRPAPAGPLIVQQPPSHPGNPVYTPPGAGLPTPGQPGAQRATLPRSPNKRLLPPTKEAGLWAADEVRASVKKGPDVELYGITYPMLADAQVPEYRPVHLRCIQQVGRAANETGLHSTLLQYPEDVRTCLAAVAVATCVGTWLDALKGVKADAAHYDAKDFAETRMAKEKAELARDILCRGVKVTDEHFATNKGVMDQWKEMREKEIWEAEGP